VVTSLVRQPLLHKRVFYWPDRGSAEIARQGVTSKYPNARIVEYLRGYAVQIYKSGPYLPLEEGELQHRFASPGDVMHSNPRTRDIDLYVSSYGDAQRFLRGKKQRKLANNTFVRDEGGTITVVLHSTPVVEYFPTGLIVLRSGGHRTTTTKQRINQLLPAGWSLYQKDYGWYLRAPDGEVQDFFDGIAIHAGLRTHGTSSRPQSNPVEVLGKRKRVGDTTFVMERAGIHGWMIKANGSVIYGPTASYDLVLQAFNEVTGHQSNPPRDKDGLVGYIDHPKAGEELTTWDGKDKEWRIVAVQETYTNRHGDRSYGVLLIKRGGRGIQYAGGLLLGDNGSLFRGRRFPGMGGDEARTEARSEAEYWAQIDDEADSTDEAEQDEDE
jgi:hypothetical protein